MNGIDISHHQGPIDFERLKTNHPKIDFIFLKATQGVGYTDPMVKINSTLAKENGIPFGYYHFASLNTKNITQDAKAEAEYFLSVIHLLPTSQLPLVLDIEDEKGIIQYNLFKSDVLGWVNSFFDTLEQAGHMNYAIYSYTPFLNSNLPLKHNLGGIPLWIAQYTVAPEPRIPLAWKDWWMWQKTDKGSVSGIKGNVDINVTRGSLY